MTDDDETSTEVVRPRGQRGLSALAATGAGLLLALGVPTWVAGPVGWMDVDGLLLAAALAWTAVSLPFRDRVELGARGLRVVSALGTPEVAWDDVAGVRVAWSVPDHPPLRLADGREVALRGCSPALAGELERRLEAARADREGPAARGAADSGA